MCTYYSHARVLQGVMDIYFRSRLTALTDRVPGSVDKSVDKLDTIEFVYQLYPQVG
jgi:hypothetical protein